MCDGSVSLIDALACGNVTYLYGYGVMCLMLLFVIVAFALLISAAENGSGR